MNYEVNKYNKFIDLIKPLRPIHYGQLPLTSKHSTNTHVKKRITDFLLRRFCR